MIKLTDRLQIIADEIKQNETMADIGTDHGFLPISLWERGICSKVIMADISEGSLNKARVNAQVLYPEETFDFRLGSGLEVLLPEEVDNVVIAGMGGILMTEIMEKDLSKTRSFKKMILQPRSGQGKLRYWLIRNDFSIMKESLVREGKYICEILTVEPGCHANAVSREISGCGPDSIEYEVPPWIWKAGPLVQEFVENRIAAEERILAGLGKSHIPDPAGENRIRENIRYLKTIAGGV